MTQPAERQADGYDGARVLVTGATGFIGAHLVTALGAVGAEVHGVARRPPAVPLAGSTRLHLVDLADLAACRALIKSTRPDRIFHLASHVTGRQDLVSVVETLNGNLVSSVYLLTAVAEFAKPGSIVVAGSSEEPRGFSLGDPETAPYSPYAAAKLAQSAYAAFFRRTLGLPISHARIFMGYGPGQSDAKKLIPHVILSLLRGITPALSSGRRLADWTYIADIVDALMVLGLRSAGPSPAVPSLDIGTGTLTSVADIALQLRDIIAPAGHVSFGAAADRLYEAQHVADVVQSKALTEWQPAVDLETGLRRTVDWYRTHLNQFG